MIASWPASSASRIFPCHGPSFSGNSSLCLRTLWAAHRIAQRLFPEPRAQWAGVALLAAMFTLPVAGTALNIADQHLHPRNLATALILLRGRSHPRPQKPGRQSCSLIAALLMHPIMAAFGISFCFFLALLKELGVIRLRGSRASTRQRVLASSRLPFRSAGSSSLPRPPGAAPSNTRTYYFLYQWTWYEWLGAIGPLVLSGCCGATPLQRGESACWRASRSALSSIGVFQQAVRHGPARSRRRSSGITPLQPMRYLHLVYVFLVLIAGCLLGATFWRRAVGAGSCFLSRSMAACLLSQRLLFPPPNTSNCPGAASRKSMAPGVCLDPPEHARRTPTSRSIPITWRRPGRTTTAFALWPNAASLPTPSKTRPSSPRFPNLAPAGPNRSMPRQVGVNFQLADFERLKGRVRRRLGSCFHIRRPPV